MARSGGGEKGPGARRFCHACGTKLSEPVGRFCPGCGTAVGSEGHAERRTRSWVIGLIALAALAAGGAVLLVAGGGSSGKPSGGSEITALPSPSELPSRTVALVSHMPTEAGTITQAELDHAIAQSAAQAGLDSSPASGSPKYRDTAEAALGELLSSIWIQGEAARMGIGVTSREVAEEREELKKESFKSDDEYQKFLAESHYTKADVDERVEDQMLSTKIEHRVQRGLKSEAAKQEAVVPFVKAYDKRWRARTVCAPRYAIERCSNGPASSGEGSEANRSAGF